MVVLSKKTRQSLSTSSSSAGKTLSKRKKRTQKKTKKKRLLCLVLPSNASNVKTPKSVSQKVQQHPNANAFLFIVVERTKKGLALLSEQNSTTRAESLLGPRETTRGHKKKGIISFRVVVVAFRLLPSLSAKEKAPRVHRLVFYQEELSHYIQKKIERETTQQKHAPARASKEREKEREREKQRGYQSVACARHVGSSTPDDADIVPVDDDADDDDEREKTDDVDGVECFCARDKKPRNEREWAPTGRKKKRPIYGASRFRRYRAIHRRRELEVQRHASIRQGISRNAEQKRSQHREKLRRFLLSDIFALAVRERKLRLQI